MRPTGDRKPSGDPQTFSLKTKKYANAPTGVNLTAQLSLKATHMGTHRIIAMIDGEEEGLAPFTLQPEKVDG